MYNEHSTDSMFNSYDTEEYNTDNSDLSLHKITKAMIKSFIKENKNTTLKELLTAYNQDFSDGYSIHLFNDCIIKVKELFNLLMIDCFNDNETINRHTTQRAYLIYANKQLNEHITKMIKQ